MSASFVFPGSFSPPTYGHAAIVKQAAKTVPELIINCSWNPDKQNWFSMNECAALWQSYDLPKNVTIRTFGELKDQIDLKDVVMVRGLRSESDLKEESGVMKFNKDLFGISQYLYFLSDDKYRDISSTKARKVAEDVNLETIGSLVAPLIVSALLEKSLQQRNIFLVVGKPGGGKSTFLQELVKADKQNIHINTDLFNKKLRPLAEAAFPGQDLVKVALEKPTELKEIMGKPWLTMLRNELLMAPKDCNVFIEAAYGLAKTHELFRFVGGKVIYVGCTDGEYEKRVLKRGTPELLPFINQIPGLEESKVIAKQHKLEFRFIDTACGIEHLPQLAQELTKELGTS